MLIVCNASWDDIIIKRPMPVTVIVSGMYGVVTWITYLDEEDS